MKTNDKVKEEMYGLIDRWQSSGIKQREFCNAEGINFYKFKYWRTQQNKEANKTLPIYKPKHQAQKFIPIEVAKNELTIEGLQVTYPNGVSITCPPQTGIEQLSELIKIY